MQSLIKRWGRDFLIIMLCALFLQLGLGLQKSVYTNFVAEDLHLSAEQLGWVEGIREVPGLLTIVLALPAIYFTESVFSAITVLFVAVGLIFYSRATGFSSLAFSTVILSIGFHLFSPVQSSMVLRISKPNERAMRLGILNSVTAFAAVLATLFVWQFNRILSYRNYFFVAAIICFVGAGVILVARRGEKAEIRRRAVFRWEYMDYYILTLLAGSRRHMNATFATFALVQLGHVPVTVMSTLFLIANLMAIATRPILGKMIDKWGEGRSLTFNYAVVVVLFLGYAFLRNVWMLYAIFIIDNLFLGFDIAITTYLSKIAPHGDIAPSLSMGSTIQHIAAVAIPVLGGWLWDTVSPTATFLAGALLCVVSLIQAHRLPVKNTSQTANSAM